MCCPSSLHVPFCTTILPSPSLLTRPLPLVRSLSLARPLPLVRPLLVYMYNACTLATSWQFSPSGVCHSGSDNVKKYVHSLLASVDAGSSNEDRLQFIPCLGLVGRNVQTHGQRHASRAGCVHLQESDTKLVQRSREYTTTWPIQTNRLLFLVNAAVDAPPSQPCYALALLGPANMNAGWAASFMMLEIVRRKICFSASLCRIAHRFLLLSMFHIPRSDISALSSSTVCG
jgi:hypothetical protein